MYTSTTQPRNVGPKPQPSSSTPRPFGLRVRVSLDTTQRFLFGGDGPSLPTRLAEELCVLVARIVVSDFRIHSQLDRTVPAVLRNVRLGFWSCARVPPLMLRPPLPVARSAAFFSPAWLSRPPISPFALRGSARTQNAPFGSNASRSRTTVGLSDPRSRRRIVTVVSRRLVVVPRPRPRSLPSAISKGRSNERGTSACPAGRG